MFYISTVSFQTIFAATNFKNHSPPDNGLGSVQHFDRGIFITGGSLWLLVPRLGAIRAGRDSWRRLLRTALVRELERGADPGLPANNPTQPESDAAHRT